MGAARGYFEQGLDVATKIQHRPEIALIRLGLAELDAAERYTEATRAHLDACISELEQMKIRPGLALALRAWLGL